MKNLKKVLAMVLAFACTFTMFAGAAVFEDVPAGSDYSEAITMLSDLKIIQGKTETTYGPEDTIKRAEACALIARMMTGSPTVEGFAGAQNFTDVPKGYWAESAIGYCVVNGIAIGTGNGKFEPERSINDAEFVTMVVRAMGYETPDMKQNYPHSYMSSAMAKGLLDGVNMMATSDALRGENAQIIYNALFADYARGAYNDNQTHGTTTQAYPTLAESVWNLSKARVGNWDGKEDEKVYLDESNCEAHTWVVIGNDPNESGHILAYPIDDDKETILYDSQGDKNGYKPYSFKYEGDAESIRGYKVELYGQGSHGKPVWDKSDSKFTYSDNWTIKAIKTVKGQTKTAYNASMKDDVSLSLDDASSNASKVDARDAGALDLYVGKEYNGYKTGDKLEDALNVRDGAQYQLMDWNGDGETDWIVVDTANYYKVESATSKNVIVSAMKAGTKWETSTTSEKDTWKVGDWNDIKVDGEDYKIKYEGADSLKEGDIVEVAYGTPVKNEITATVSVIDAESMTLDKVSTKGGLSLTFSGEEIEVAQDVESGDVIVPENPAKYRDFNSEELGTEFDLYLNRNGFIVYSDYTTERAAYAMILDAASGNDKVSNRKLAKVDLLTGDNKHLKDVEIADDATIDGYNASDRSVDEQKMVGNVYKYWVNDDGEITRMSQLIQPRNDDDTISDEEYTYDTDADRLRDSDGRYVASLEDADVVFAVKANNNVDSRNKGYIETQTKKISDKEYVTDYYVDVNNVLAVNQKDIPDIGTDADTQTAYLDDAQVVAEFTHQGTWLDNGVLPGLGAKFVASLDNNGNAQAAVLGVENFNKFNAGATKIGLVTDVAYVNNSEGKYVEVTAAFDGENKTIASTKKVNFGDIVKAYNGSSDVSVGSPSSQVDTNLFGKKELDKYLEDSAAYAEISTDADGNLTKVVFLNKDGKDANKLNGHYYSVTRNVTRGFNEKSMNYLLNDGSSQSLSNGQVYIAKQLFADDGKLYSINSLPNENGAFTSDTKFYSIDGKATRADKNYSGTGLDVSAGFEGTPKITAGDYSVIYESSIDVTSDRYKDSYGVADIVTQNNGDVAAVYAFEDALGEENPTDVAVVSMTGEAKAGNPVQLDAVVVDSNAGAVMTGVKVEDATGADVTAAWGVDGKVLNNGKSWTDTDVTIPVTANGSYTIYAMNGSKKYTIGALKVTITDGKVQYWTVDDMGFAAPRGDGNYTMLPSGQVAAKNKYTVYVYAISDSMPDSKPATYASLYNVANDTEMDSNKAVNNLTAADLKMQVNGVDTTITGMKQTSTDGVYEVTLGTALNLNDQVSVQLISSNDKVIAGAVAGKVFSGYVTTLTADDVTDPTQTEFDLTKSQVSIKTAAGTSWVAASTTALKTQAVNNFEVQLVNKDGKAVSNLSASDFQILNGGYPVEIASVVESATTKGQYRITLKADVTDKDVLQLNVKGSNFATLTIDSNATPPSTVDKMAGKPEFRMVDKDGAVVEADAPVLTNDGKTFIVYVPEGGKRTLSGDPMTGLSADMFKVTIGGNGVDIVTSVVPVEGMPGYYEITVSVSLTGKTDIEVSVQVKDGDPEASVKPEQAPIAQEKVAVSSLNDKVYKTDDEFAKVFGQIPWNAVVIKELNLGLTGTGYTVKQEGTNTAVGMVAGSYNEGTEYTVAPFVYTYTTNEDTEVIFNVFDSNNKLVKSMLYTNDAPQKTSMWDVFKQVDLVTEASEVKVTAQGLELTYADKNKAARVAEALNSEKGTATNAADAENVKLTVNGKDYKVTVKAENEKVTITMGDGVQIQNGNAVALKLLNGADAHYVVKTEDGKVDLTNITASGIQ